MPTIAKFDSSGLRLIDRKILSTNSKISKSKKWRAVEFKRGRGRISFSPDIIEDPNSAGDWMLNILAVPDVKLPGHEHFILDKRDIVRLHEYLGRLRKHIAGLKKKKSRRKK